MSENSIPIAHEAAKKITAKAHRANSLPFLVAGIVYVASISGLAIPWFTRAGSFRFDPFSKLDWTVSIAVLVLVAIGLAVIRRGYLSPSEFTVSRTDLVFLVGSIRASAERSIRIVAGDVSWLADDISLLISIKKTAPNLAIHLYYQADRVSIARVRDLRMLAGIGVQMHPYASESRVSARFTLIDVEKQGCARALTYQKLKPESLNEVRDANKFLCIDYGLGKMTPVVEAFASVCDLLDGKRSGPIRISISGLNNVGKTRLASGLRDRLVSKGVTVRFVPDQFRILGSGDTPDASHLILLRSLLELQKSAAEQVTIFDRSVIDDFVFLRLRNQHNHEYGRLGESIAALASQFSIIVQVMPPQGKLRDTKNLTSNERISIVRLFNEFISTHDIKVRRVQGNLSSVLGPNALAFLESLADEVVALVNFALEEIK